MSDNPGFRQDMPPPGGYRKFNYARTFPKLVWRPGIVVAAVFGTTVVGVFQSIAKKKAMVTEKFEDVDIINAMEPFLTAERDRYWLKLVKKTRDLEEEVMKDVPGWKTVTAFDHDTISKYEKTGFDSGATPCVALLHSGTVLDATSCVARGTWYGEPVYFTLGDKWWDPSQHEVFAHSEENLFLKEHLWRHHSEYAAPKFYDKWIPEFIGKYIW